MDAAQERLQALSYTQQALMDKIKALDELDQADGEPLSPAPSASACTPRASTHPKHCFCARPPPSPSQIMVSSATSRKRTRCACPGLPVPAHHCTASATQQRGRLLCRDSLSPCGTQAPQQPQDEEALLSMLLQKQAELQKMRAAIDELKTMDAGVTVRRATA